MHDLTTTLPSPGTSSRAQRMLLITLAAALLAPLLLVWAPDQAGGQSLPGRYEFRALSFRAIDETGADWAGSDEIYLKTWDHTRNSYGSGHNRTSTYSGVDTGESRTIKSTEQCIAATQAIVDKNSNGNLNGSQGDTWTCKSGNPGIGTIDATVKLYEQETFGDQTLGTKHIKLSAPELAQLMPNKGDFNVRTERFTNNGTYDVVFVIQRTQ